MLNIVKPEVILENPEEAALIDSDAIATARTTVSFEAVSSDEIDIEKSKGLSKRLILPGHLSPFLNRSITFRIEGISRNASTWLHLISKYYNTGQYSQRYLKLSKDNSVPPVFLPASYSRLSEDLKNEVENFFKKRDEDYKEIMKLHAQELLKRGTTDSMEKGMKITTQYARDVFPSAVFTAMRHSTNVIQLGRLYILSLKAELPEDLKDTIKAMWEELKEKNKVTCNAIEEVYSNEEIFDISNFNYDADSSYAWFDKFLGQNIVRLYDELNNFYERLRIELNILGLKDINPKKIFFEYNKENFRNAFGFQNISIIGKAFDNILNFGFYTKMSHSQLEQSARHRSINHNTNPLLPIFLSEPAYIIPPPLRYSKEIKEIFRNAFEETWDLKEKLFDSGMKPVDISYILPRGTSYLVSVSGGFNDLRHYLNLRSCASAQFNIYEMAIALINEMEKSFQIPKKVLGPKCIHAKKCVEGHRTCNLFPWLKNDLNEVLKLRFDKGF